MYEIRRMTPADAALAADWAAAEGWNPGLHDADCFRDTDPDGFLMGVLDGSPAASISVVNYDDRFAFLGFYIARPEVRGRGYGLRLWEAGMAHAGHRIVGLDGVPAQQDNYRKSGFYLAWRNVRYGGAVASSQSEADGRIVPLSDIGLGEIAALDRRVFPADRSDFLRRWIETPGHVALGLVRDGALVAFGVIRPCRADHKVGPLVADSRQDAEALLDALIGQADASHIYLDVPEPNLAACALAEARGLQPAFETARMYARGMPEVAVDCIFGVTTFELG